MNLDWKKTTLETWLLLDNWTSDQALGLLAGFDPDADFMEPNKVPDIDNNYLHAITGLLEWPLIREIKISKDREPDWSNLDWRVVNEEFGKNVHDATRNYKIYEKIWQSSDSHTEEDYHRTWAGDPPTLRPPKIYIDYFVKKNKPPHWLDWAIENHLYTTVNSKSSNIDVKEEHIDVKEDFYHLDRIPHELKTCIDVYNHFKNMPDEEFKYQSPRKKIQAYIQKEYPSLLPEAVKRLTTVVNWKKGNPNPKKKPNK